MLYQTRQSVCSQSSTPCMCRCDEESLIHQWRICFCNMLIYLSQHAACNCGSSKSPQRMLCYPSSATMMKGAQLHTIQVENMELYLPSKNNVDRNQVQLDGPCFPDSHVLYTTRTWQIQLPCRFNATARARLYPLMQSSQQRPPVMTDWNSTDDASAEWPDSVC